MNYLNPKVLSFLPALQSPGYYFPGELCSFSMDYIKEYNHKQYRNQQPRCPCEIIRIIGILTVTSL